MLIRLRGVASRLREVTLRSLRLTGRRRIAAPRALEILFRADEPRAAGNTLAAKLLQVRLCHTNAAGRIGLTITRPSERTRGLLDGADLRPQTLRDRLSALLTRELTGPLQRGGDDLRDLLADVRRDRDKLECGITDAVAH